MFDIPSENSLPAIWSSRFGGQRSRVMGVAMTKRDVYGISISEVVKAVKSPQYQWQSRIKEALLNRKLQHCQKGLNKRLLETKDLKKMKQNC